MTTPQHDLDAQALINLYQAKWAAIATAGDAARAGDLDGDQLSLALDAGDQETAACEDFRRKHYPSKRTHRIIASDDAVYLVSATARSVTRIYQTR